MAAVPALALLYPTLLASLATQYNYTVFPDDNGVLHLIDRDESALSIGELAELQQNVDSVSFWLYTRQNPTNGKRMVPEELSEVSNLWKSERPTRFVTHGWRGSGNSVSCTGLRNAYLAVGDFNVVVIDWSSIASSILYGKVVKSIPVVARYVAYVMEDMKVFMGLDLSTTKMVGHSLGAHLAGLSAREVSGNVAEVVGLDPAKPHFEDAKPDARIDATDATHVQIIHTNVGLLGIKEAIGTSDFYPNSGRYQPGCPSYDIFGVCDHSRSYLYFAESILNEVGFRASSVDGDLEEVAYMGGPSLDPKAKGTYSLKTASTSPYALG
ncbi:hypothetical protein KM043_007820 [Ampulex compressa]|nr:hypothetical protein KM043_007820 [Ampulex compressa]